MCYVQSVFHKIHLHRFHFGAIQIWASPILSLCNSTKLHFLHKIDKFARKKKKGNIDDIKWKRAKEVVLDQALFKTKKIIEDRTEFSLNINHTNILR